MNDMDSIQNWTLITSIIGAAAWIPHLVSLVKKLMTKSVLTITPSRMCVVGFTELGPIFNIKMAITSDNQSILIDRIELKLLHDSGAEHLFRWHEVAEVRGQMIVPGVQNRPLIHASEAIALKILPTDFKDVSLQCRLEEHTEGLRTYEYEFTNERRRLSNSGQYDPLAFYSSKTVQDMRIFMQSQMIWRKGTYQVCCLVHNLNNAEIRVPSLKFSLTDTDIVLLQANNDNLPRLLRNACLTDTPQVDQSQPLEWHWLDRKLTQEA